MSRTSIRAILTAATVFLPTMAMAHPAHDQAFGFAHGFAHPMGGLDHILAMVMVGLLAAQIGGRAICLVPASFVAVMALGGGLGVAGNGMPFVEIGIALSVVVLGGIVAFRLATPVAVAMGLVGFFAIFHGYAHGAEMPGTAAGLAYGAGFVAATILLHALGIAGGLLLGRAGAKAHGATVVQSLGAAASLAGVGILAGII